MEVRLMDSDLLEAGALRCLEVSAAGLSNAPTHQKISREKMRMIVVETEHCSRTLAQILCVIKAWSVIAFTISMRSDRTGQFIDLCCPEPTAEAREGVLRALNAIKNVRYVALETLSAD